MQFGGFQNCILYAPNARPGEFSHGAPGLTPDPELDMTTIACRVCIPFIFGTPGVYMPSPGVDHLESAFKYREVTAGYPRFFLKKIQDRAWTVTPLVTL